MKASAAAAESNTSGENQRPCVNLYFNGKTICKFFMDGASVSGYDWNFLLPDFSQRGTTVVTDKNGSCVYKAVMDLWGQTLSEASEDGYGGKASDYLSYSYSGYTLSGELLMYDLGQRDYCPSMKGFTTEDPARDGNNWYAYCPFDCVNYFDFQGYRKNSMSDEEFAGYTGAIADIAGFDRDKYAENGGDKGIPKETDCADTSSLIDKIASEAAGYNTNSRKQKTFNDFVNDDNLTAARDSVQSIDFCNPKNSDSYRKVTSGYDRDLIRTFKYKGDQYSQKLRVAEIEKKQKAIDELKNPDNISPGSVLVWKKSENALNPGRKWVGHTMTVLAREFDANGNVVGFMYIEGHQGGGKTDVGYLKLDGYELNLFNLDSWEGAFQGLYEIEASDSKKCNG